MALDVSGPGYEEGAESVENELMAPRGCSSESDARIYARRGVF